MKREMKAKMKMKMKQGGRGGEGPQIAGIEETGKGVGASGPVRASDEGERAFRLRALRPERQRDGAPSLWDSPMIPVLTGNAHPAAFGACSSQDRRPARVRTAVRSRSV